MDHNEEIQVELTQEQFSFLEDFQGRCGSPASSDISKASVLRCLLRLFREVKADVRGVQTEDELRNVLSCYHVFLLVLSKVASGRRFVRSADGIQKAKERGVKFGRKKKVTTSE